MGPVDARDIGFVSAAAVDLVAVDVVRPVGGTEHLAYSSRDRAFKTACSPYVYLLIGSTE